MFVETNINPMGKRVGDCTVRAVGLATGQTWDQAYSGLTAKGFQIKDMPSANEVVGEYLAAHGFRRYPLPDTCPACYTVEQFARNHPHGTYVALCDAHVVCIKDGNILDTWNSGDQTALAYWEGM